VDYRWPHKTSIEEIDANKLALDFVADFVGMMETSLAVSVAQAA